MCDMNFTSSSASASSSRASQTSLKLKRMVDSEPIREIFSGTSTVILIRASVLIGMNTSSPNFSASITIRSMSGADSRPLSFMMLTLVSFSLRAASQACTFRMPFASMSKVSCTSHRRSVLTFTRWSSVWASRLLSRVCTRSPSKTAIWIVPEHQSVYWAGLGWSKTYEPQTLQTFN